MAAVNQLTPGDQVSVLGVGTATFIAYVPHPIYLGLMLVIWWIPLEMRYSFDALSEFQEVGKIEPNGDRKANLMAAFRGERS